MKAIQTWFDEYAESHQNPINKLFHWICIPLIVFSLLGLLASIPSDFLQNLVGENLKPYIHFGTVLLIASLIFYLSLSIPMAIGMLIFSLLCLQGIVWIENSEFPLWLVSLIIFALAWIGQFIGHSIEGKKPSFIKDLQFLMIGPAWLLGFIYKKLGIPY
tara:strand:- start:3328 stop:3807 length:480 start_codon:yes stop_codon:yes gene_type:complete